MGFCTSPDAMKIVKRYAKNGREAINMIQLGAGLAVTENRNILCAADLEWVASNSQLQPFYECKIHHQPRIGSVNGLAIQGPNLGSLLDIEVTAVYVGKGKGKINITGVVDEEELKGRTHKLTRKSMARSSVENVLTVLALNKLCPENYNIHINFCGGIPIDGPSAGIAMIAAITSAICCIPVHHEIAMTGEVSIHGEIKPVGGILAKIDAAIQAGVKQVIIPRQNWHEGLQQKEGIQIIPVKTVKELFHHVFHKEELIPFSTKNRKHSLVDHVSTVTSSVLRAKNI